jgi:aminodeoxyfutalosine synthase
VALRFGADDMDGTVVEEKIYHMAGAGTSQQLSRSELERVLREAGFVPVERDTLYNPVVSGGAGSPGSPMPQTPQTPQTPETAAVLAT